MDNAASAKNGQIQRGVSIKRKLLIFSAILFCLIFICGSIAFGVSAWNISHANAGRELAREVEIESIKLEASVNAEIAIALKMADSPIIKQYFMDPSNTNLQQTAFREISGYRRAFKGNNVFWVNDIDHMFYKDDDPPFFLDINDPSNYWYLMTLNQRERYNFNINYNPSLNSTDLWINANVLDDNGTPIGILGTGINLTSFVDSIYSNYKGKAALYFFNKDFEITGARDAQLVANKVRLDVKLGETGGQIIARVGDIPQGDALFFPAHDGEVALGRVPALDWYIVAILPLTLIDALSTSMTVLFVAMVLAIAAILAIFLLLIGWMLQPLNAMISTLDSISTDWDLKRQVEVQHNDEIGILGDFFNLTFGKMKDLILGIKGRTVALLDTGDELASYMTKTRTDIEGISDNIQNMVRKVLSQSDKVNATAGSMKHIISGLDKLNGHIATQSESVAQSSSAIEEMLANIKSVTQTLIKNTDNIKSLASSSQASRADLEKVSADIQEIARESEGLLEINSVMQNIASQTNLLSMNAAIEAAHAGETGQGFAVVADEIRKLAENSSKQSKTISVVLKKIKSSIDAITKSTALVMERFSAMEDEVRVVSDQETQIRNAMEEQGEGSRQILEAVTQLNSVTNLVRGASGEMTQDSKNVMIQSEELKKITEDVAGSMDEMTMSSHEISNTITRVQEISEENKFNIDTLSEDIGKFKVD
jgi:methyl-accepting chemotaxis protein